jgi:hypothetical protein
MTALDQLRPLVGVKRACRALSVPRATWYRRRRPRLAAGVSVLEKGRRHSPRALSDREQSAVLTCLHEERFQDCSPAQVYAALLDEGRFHCSIRTMYRLLETHGESRERRDQLTHPPYQKPELLATAPNQLYLVMEYIEGVDPPSLGLQRAPGHPAIDSRHQGGTRNIIRRDLKPANIRGIRVRAGALRNGPITRRKHTY